MIYLTGDTHGIIDIHKLSSSNFIHGKNLTKDDYLIILGDFGFLWKDEPDSQEEYWLKWLDEKPWTTLVVDGNHENHPRLYALEQVEMFESTVGKISDTVFHLKRGEIYNIYEETFFVMGGAYSIDKGQPHRQLGRGWWEEEQPSVAEYEYGLANLEKHGNKVDYVLGHTCPRSVVRMYFDSMEAKKQEMIRQINEATSNGKRVKLTGAQIALLHFNTGDYYDKFDGVTTYFEEIAKRVDFNTQYYGHFHDNWVSDCKKYVMLYEQIITLGQNPIVKDIDVEVKIEDK